jgi:hypothetical protein
MTTNFWTLFKMFCFCSFTWIRTKNNNQFIVFVYKNIRIRSTQKLQFKAYCMNDIWTQLCFNYCNWIVVQLIDIYFFKVAFKWIYILFFSWLGGSGRAPTTAPTKARPLAKRIDIKNNSQNQIQIHLLFNTPANPIINGQVLQAVGCKGGAPKRGDWLVGMLVPSMWQGFHWGHEFKKAKWQATMLLNILGPKAKVQTNSKFTMSWNSLKLRIKVKIPKWMRWHLCHGPINDPLQRYIKVWVGNWRGNNKTLATFIV